MNKFLGYTEIEFNKEIIPIKIGMFSLEMFCEVYPTTLSTIQEDVFETRTLPDGKSGVLPKDMSKFFTRALWAGANYASKINGGKDYSIIEAYQWADELGFASDKSLKIITEFYTSILNGGPLPKKSEISEDAKPKKTTKEAKKKN